VRIYSSSEVLNGWRESAFHGRLGEGTAWLFALAALSVISLWSQNNFPKQQEIQAHMQRAQQALRSNGFAAAEVGLKLGTAAVDVVRTYLFRTYA